MTFIGVYLYIRKYISKHIRLLARFGAALVVVLLVAWLAFDSPPTEARWKAITAEFDRGTIGKLPPEESALLKETIKWLSPHAGVQGSIIVNEKPQPGSLHVYTTTPEAVAITGCARGNAVYDSLLNAVFIDENILRPEELPLLGAKGRRSMVGLKDLTFVPVYLRFILLHELGHLQLHRQTGGFFDLSSGSRDTEQEADDFAIRTLRVAYASDLAVGGRRIGKGAGEFIQMKGDDLSAEERVWVDMVGSISVMSVALMFSASDFSSFYEDTAHPNFIKRATAILDLAVGSPEASPTLKAHAAFHRQSLIRLQNLAGAKFAELQFPEGVQKVAFGASELLVMTNGGHVFAMPLSDVGQAISRENRTLRFTQPTVRGPYHDIDDDDAWLSSIWAPPSIGPVIIRPEGGEFEMNAVTIRNNSFIQLPTLKQGIGKEIYSPDLFTPPQPAEIAILSDSTHREDDFMIIRGGEVIRRINWGTLLDAISAEAKLPSVRVEIGTVMGETANLSIYDNSGPRERLFGIAELNLVENDLRSVVPLRFEYEGGGDAPGLLGDKLVVIPRQTGPIYVLVTRNREHFQAYILSRTNPMKLLCEQSFILDTTIEEGAKSELLGAFDPQLSDAQLIPPKFVLATFSGDSIYVVDVDTGQTSIAFTPGTDVQSVVSSKGHLALFIANGRKVYVVKPGQEAL